MLLPQQARLLRIGPGFPMKFPRKPWCAPWSDGEPKPILNAYSTQMIRTVAKAANTSIMLLIDQRFCITPP